MELPQTAIILLVVPIVAALYVIGIRRMVNGHWHRRYRCNNCGATQKFVFPGDPCGSCGERTSWKECTARATLSGWKFKD